MPEFTCFQKDTVFPVLRKRSCTLLSKTPADPDKHQTPKKALFYLNN